jgi:hypothetical protein
MDHRLDEGRNGDWAIMRYIPGGAYFLSNKNCTLEIEHIQTKHKWKKRLVAGVPVFEEVDRGVTVLVYYDT